MPNEVKRVDVWAALAGSLMLVCGWLFLPSFTEMFGSLLYQRIWTVFVFGSSAWMLADALRTAGRRPAKENA